MTTDIACKKINVSFDFLDVLRVYKTCGGGEDLVEDEKPSAPSQFLTPWDENMPSPTGTHKCQTNICSPRQDRQTCSQSGGWLLMNPVDRKHSEKQTAAEKVTGNLACVRIIYD